MLAGRMAGWRDAAGAVSQVLTFEVPQQWERILDPGAWAAAVLQVLAVCLVRDRQLVGWQREVRGVASTLDWAVLVIVNTSRRRIVLLCRSNVGTYVGTKVP